MATHPEGSAEWAENAAFASPGDAWDTDPTKVEPPAGKIAEGWEPTEEPPAEFLNWWQNKVGVLLDYLRLAHVKGWRASEVVGVDLFCAGYDPSTGIFVVSGDTADVTTYRSGDAGETWTIATTPPLAIHSRDVDSDGAGNWVVCGDSASIWESADDGDTWTQRGPLGGNFDEGNRVIYDAANGLWILTGNEDLAGDNGREIWTSPDRATWTNRVSATGGGRYVGDIDVSAAGFSVALADGTQFFTSPDGTTWTQRTFGALLTGSRDVKFSEELGLWMVIGTDGGTPVVLTSSDGINFSLVGGNYATEVTSAPSYLACDGGALWIAGFGSSISDQRVYASTDAGLTWTTVAGPVAGLPAGPTARVGSPAGGSDFKNQIKHAGGRFFLASQGGLFWRTPPR